jgi:hypothetical protein
VQTQRYPVVDTVAVAAEAHQGAALAVEVAMLHEPIADQRKREPRLPWWRRLAGSERATAVGS